MVHSWDASSAEGFFCPRKTVIFINILQGLWPDCQGTLSVYLLYVSVPVSLRIIATLDAGPVRQIPYHHSHHPLFRIVPVPISIRYVPLDPLSYVQHVPAM
jgi:hypothetical protein